jgi:hypothetical protein
MLEKVFENIAISKLNVLPMLKSGNITVEVSEKMETELNNLQWWEVKSFEFCHSTDLNIFECNVLILQIKKSIFERIFYFYGMFAKNNNLRNKFDFFAAVLRSS